MMKAGFILSVALCLVAQIQCYGFGGFGGFGGGFGGRYGGNPYLGNQFAGNLPFYFTCPTTPTNSVCQTACAITAQLVQQTPIGLCPFGATTGVAGVQVPLGVCCPVVATTVATTTAVTCGAPNQCIIGCPAPNAVAATCAFQTGVCCNALPCTAPNVCVATGVCGGTGNTVAGQVCAAGQTCCTVCGSVRSGALAGSCVTANPTPTCAGGSIQTVACNGVQTCCFN